MGHWWPLSPQRPLIGEPDSGSPLSGFSLSQVGLGWMFPGFASEISFLVVPTLTTAHLGRTFFLVSQIQLPLNWEPLCHFKVIILFCLTPGYASQRLPPCMPKSEGLHSTDPVSPSTGQCLQLGRNAFAFLFSCSPPIDQEVPLKVCSFRTFLLLTHRVESEKGRENTRKHKAQPKEGLGSKYRNAFHLSLFKCKSKQEFTVVCTLFWAWFSSCFQPFWLFQLWI